MVDLSIDLSGVAEVISEMLESVMSTLNELIDGLAPYLVQSEQFAQDNPGLYLQLVARLRHQYGSPQTSGPPMKILHE